LHKKNIGHRDLKTENLLIDKNFNLKIADFGCSCKTRINGERISFNNDQVIGSPEFNPPEISNKSTEGGKYFAEEADIFNLASVLFLMVMKSGAFNSSQVHDEYYKRLCQHQKFWEVFEALNIPSLEFKSN
jgi:serine/threonine protein kinase